MVAIDGQDRKIDYATLKLSVIFRFEIKNFCKLIK